MVQESTLRVGVDSRPGVKGLRDFDGALDRSGRKAKRTESQFERLQNGIGGLQAAFAAVGVGLAVREFSRLLDVTTQIDNQLRLVTNTTGELNAVYDELFKISQRTRTSIADNAEVFKKLGVATKGLNLTYREQLGLVEKLNQTLIISGTNAQQGAAALRQLAQGLAAGALRGDEFVSVSENIPKLLDVVVQELNRTSKGARVTRGDLRDLASEGKLTADLIVSAFQNSNLDEEFAQITPTISNAFTVLNNKVLDFTRNLNNAGAIGEVFARGILKIADNFEAVAGAAAGLAIIIGTVLVRSVASLTLALASNPIGLLTVAIAGATAAIGAFGDTTVAVGGETASVWQMVKAGIMTVAGVLSGLTEIASAAFSTMVDAGGAFFERIRTGLSGFLDDWGITLDGIVGFVKKAININIGLFVGLVAAIRPAITKGIPAVFRAAMAGARNVVVSAVEGIINALVKGLGALGDALGFIPGVSEDVGASIRNALTVDLDGLRADTRGLVADLATAGDAITTAFSNQQRDFVGEFGEAVSGAASSLKDEFSKNLEEVKEDAKEAANANELLNRTFSDVQTGSNSAGDAVDEAGKAAGRASKKNKDLNEDLKRQKQLLQELTNPTAELQTRLNDLTALYQKGAIGARVFNRELVDTRLRMMELKTEAGGGGFADGFLVELGRMTDGVRSFEVEAGAAFGQVFNTLSRGYSQAISDAITGTESFGDSIKKVASQAIGDLIASLTELSIKILTDQALTAIIGGGFGGFGGGFGSNPLAAIAGQTLGAFADGGMVRAPGGPRSDAGLAAVSDGEFVVNAAATKRNRSTLEAINNGEDAGGSTTIVQNFYIQTPDADSFQRSQGQIMARGASQLNRARRRNN